MNKRTMAIAVVVLVGIIVLVAAWITECVPPRPPSVVQPTASLPPPPLDQLRERLQVFAIHAADGGVKVAPEVIPGPQLVTKENREQFVAELVGRMVLPRWQDGKLELLGVPAKVSADTIEAMVRYYAPILTQQEAFAPGDWVVRIEWTGQVKTPSIGGLASYDRFRTNAVVSDMGKPKFEPLLYFTATFKARDEGPELTVREGKYDLRLYSSIRNLIRNLIGVTVINFESAVSATSYDSRTIADDDVTLSHSKPLLLWWVDDKATTREEQRVERPENLYVLQGTKGLFTFVYGSTFLLPVEIGKEGFRLEPISNSGRLEYSMLVWANGEIDYKGP